MATHKPIAEDSAAILARMRELGLDRDEGARPEAMPWPVTSDAMMAEPRLYARNLAHWPVGFRGQIVADVTSGAFVISFGEKGYRRVSRDRCMRRGSVVPPSIGDQIVVLPEQDRAFPPCRCGDRVDPGMTATGELWCIACLSPIRRNAP